MKMEEYDAAVNYLDDLLELYFDTEYADRARVLMVETLLTAKKIVEAESFLEKHSSRFSDDTFREDAHSLIEKHESEQDQKS